jgi:hypothetical protein
MNTRRSLAVALVALLIPAIGSVSMRGQSPAGVPPYLNLLSARIHEEAPFEPEARANRQVVFTLVASAQPPCAAQAARTEYAFLIDKDGLPTTGVRLAAIPEMGADGTILIRCDPARRTYVSAAGPVEIRTDNEAPGAYAVEVRTRLGELPGVAFRWIAVAREGELIFRIPEPGRTAPWEHYETALW